MQKVSSKVKKQVNVSSMGAECRKSDAVKGYSENNSLKVLVDKKRYI